MDFIVEHRSSGLDEVALFLAAVGRSAISTVVVVVATLAAAVRRRQWAWGAAVSLAAIGSVALAAVGKALIERPRPPSSQAILVAHGSSMPSSVALLCAGMATAAVLGWEPPAHGRRRVALAWVSVVALVFGAAVVYLGVHWISDVLVGWGLGCAVGAAAVPTGRVASSWLREVAPGLFAAADRFARPER
ncbi:MAG: hypothetical protein JWM47_3103 [Acidimicrobiales bacterium]|nr:hypothetical protein [Acidimicrobiales bacterium]